ncbi:MAG: autotransporter-associated beta strand repeat-containing protein [Kiritimatiellia bacterium]|jgi:autotransporter-associated beta strand protein
MTTIRPLALCSVFVFVLAFAISPPVEAAPAWTTDSYDPTQWTASSNNVLLGVTAGGSVSIYTEGGKDLSTDPATLTDGVVPGATTDFTKIFAIRSGSLEWTFGSETSISELRIFTRWCDGGRDGINITSVAVKYTAGGNWEALSAVPPVDYGNWDNNTSSHLSAILLDSTGDALATGVVGLKLEFGTQDNNGTGYAEIEALEPETGAVRAIVTRKYVAPRKAGLEATILNCGDGGSTVDFYFAYGPSTNALPAATCYTNGLVQGDSFEIPLAGLALGTTYSYSFYAVNDLGATSRVGSGSFTTLDGSTITWTGLVSDNWSDGMNWDTEIAPSGQIPKVVLNTPAGSFAPADLDIAGLAIDDLCFGSGCTNDFTISGAPVTLKTLSSRSDASATVTIQNDVTFNGTGRNRLANGNMAVRFDGVVSGGDASGGFYSDTYGNIHFRNPANDFVGNVGFHLGSFYFCADGCLGIPPAEPTDDSLYENYGALVLDRLPGANLHQTRQHANRTPRGTIILCDGTELFYDGELPADIEYRHSGNDIKHLHLGGTARTVDDTAFIRLDGSLLAIMESDTAFGDATRCVRAAGGSIVDFNGHSTSAKLINYLYGFDTAPVFINSDREHETTLSGDIILGLDYNTRFFGGPGAIRVEGPISEDEFGRHFHWAGPGKLTLAGTNAAWNGDTQFMGGSVDLDYRTNRQPKFPGNGFAMTDCHLRLLGHPTETTTCQPDSISLNIYIGGLSVLEAFSTGADTTLQIGALSGMQRHRMVDFRTHPSAGGTASIVITNMANDATFGGIGPNYTWDHGRNWAYINADGTVGPMPDSLFSSTFDAGVIWDIPAGETEITAPWDGIMPNGIRIAGTEGPTTLTISGPVNIKKCGAETIGGILISADVGGDVVIDGASRINPENYNGGLVIQNWSTNHTTRISVRLEETNDNDFSIVGPGTTILENDDNSYYYGPHVFGGGTVKFTSIANARTNSALGKGRNDPVGEIQCGAGCTYEYIGTNVEGHVSNRRFTLHGDGTLKASGAGPLVLGSEWPVGAAYASCRLILDGDGVGVIDGGINPGRFGSVLKRGSGTWTLDTTTSAYEYPTVVEAGTLHVHGTLPSSVEIGAGGTLLASGLVVKRDLDVAGTVRFDVSDLEANPLPLAVWGTARLGGEFQVAGRLTEPTVVLTAENGVEGTFSAVPANVKLSYAPTSVTASPRGGTLLIVR